MKTGSGSSGHFERFHPASRQMTPPPDRQRHSPLFFLQAGKKSTGTLRHSLFRMWPTSCRDPGFSRSGKTSLAGHEGRQFSFHQSFVCRFHGFRGDKQVPSFPQNDKPTAFRVPGRPQHPVNELGRTKHGDDLLFGQRQRAHARNGNSLDGTIHPILRLEILAFIMRAKVEKFSEVMSLILEKSIFGFMDATTAQWRENPVPAWEQYALIFCSDFVGGLLGLVAVMKRQLAAPARSPCSRLGATSSGAELPWNAVSGLGHTDGSERFKREVLSAKSKAPDASSPL